MSSHSTANAPPPRALRDGKSTLSVVHHGSSKAMEHAALDRARALTHERDSRINRSVPSATLAHRAHPSGAAARHIPSRWSRLAAIGERRPLVRDQCTKRRDICVSAASRTAAPSTKSTSAS